MITPEGNIVRFPRHNKPCPCNSKSKYKKCCYPKDEGRKRDFVENSTKKLENMANNLNISKPPVMLLL